MIEVRCAGLPRAAYPSMTTRFSPWKVLEEKAWLLLRAEREIALFARAAPTDSAVDARELVRAIRAGRCLRRTPPGRLPARLGSTRRVLVDLESELEGRGVLEDMIAERARELELEARLAERLFTIELRALADQRFPAPRGSLARAVDDLVERSVEAPPNEAERRHRSDDVDDPKSLLSLLRRGAFELGLPIGLEVRAGQLAVAATGEGVIAVRPGIMLSAESSARVAAHELYGHALPRVRAALGRSVLFRAGTVLSNEHEEGRALVIESRRGLLGAERLFELALRHRAALSVKDGASIEETVGMMTALGSPLERSVDIALRVHRGGGLAREIVYLPAYFEMKQALYAEPGLERWFERGRVGLPAARRFQEGALTPETPPPCRTALGPSSADP